MLVVIHVSSELSVDVLTVELDKHAVVPIRATTSGNMVHRRIVSGGDGAPLTVSHCFIYTPVYRETFAPLVWITPSLVRNYCATVDRLLDGGDSASKGIMMNGRPRGIKDKFVFHKLSDFCCLQTGAVFREIVN